MKRALLVIDMQNGSFTEATPRHDTTGVVTRINRLADAFRDTDDPVIFIQHDGRQQGDYLPGTYEWRILPDLKIVEDTDTSIGKTANDCFYRSELGPFLAVKEIKDLVITGCATDFCVDATVKAALSRDYAVTVISDGHTTADRLGISAVQVIDHYHYIWENMLPTEGRLRLLSTETYLSGL